MQNDGICRRYPTGTIWIPDAYDDVHLRLSIIDHIGAAGNRGCLSTEQAQYKRVLWSTLH